MNIFSLCCASKVISTVIPQNINNTKVSIRATTSEQSHLFRMMEVHGKCQDIEIRMLNTIAMEQIEMQRQEVILRGLLVGAEDNINLV